MESKKVMSDLEGDKTFKNSCENVVVIGVEVGIDLAVVVLVVVPVVVILVVGIDYVVVICSCPIW